MTIDYDQAETFSDWAKILESLLDDAAQASTAEARGEAAEALVDFMQRSPNWLAKDLDRVAARTVDALTLTAIEVATQKLRLQRLELQRLTKVFEAEAEANQAAARSIRLERVHATLKSTATAVEDLRTLVASLQAGDELGAVANDAVTALTSLRAALASAADKGA